MIGKINSAAKTSSRGALLHLLWSTYILLARGGYAIMREVAKSGVEFKRRRRCARKKKKKRRRIFSETAGKLPVQLNRKQYENLFESFDYTKEATVDVGESRREEGGGEKRGRIKETRTHPG